MRLFVRQNARSRQIDQRVNSFHGTAKKVIRSLLAVTDRHRLPITDYRLPVTSPLFRIRISGLSCWPYLVPGKTYWATTLRRPRVGDFVLVRGEAVGEQSIPHIVKHVARVANNALELKSTVPWGACYSVAASAIEGVVLRF